MKENPKDSEITLPAMEKYVICADITEFQQYMADVKKLRNYPATHVTMVNRLTVLDEVTPGVDEVIVLPGAAQNPHASKYASVAKEMGLLNHYPIGDMLASWYPDNNTPRDGDTLHFI